MGWPITLYLNKLTTKRGRMLQGHDDNVACYFSSNVRLKGEWYIDPCHKSVSLSNSMPSERARNKSKLVRAEQTMVSYITKHLPAGIQFTVKNMALLICNLYRLGWQIRGGEEKLHCYINFFLSTIISVHRETCWP